MASMPWSPASTGLSIKLGAQFWGGSDTRRYLPRRSVWIVTPSPQLTNYASFETSVKKSLPRAYMIWIQWQSCHGRRHSGLTLGSGTRFPRLATSPPMKPHGSAMPARSGPMIMTATRKSKRVTIQKCVTRRHSRINPATRLASI
jgi:hypothetical protein